jgi:4-hydroxybenzoate polyprenyltransferase
MRNPKLLALSQLMRLPNVFTAFADILLGAATAGYLTQRLDLVFILLISSGCLYLGGMVINDYFDREADARTQAFRPIPSGRIRSRTAGMIGALLLILGIGSASLTLLLANYSTDRLMPPVIAMMLVIAIISYNYYLKHTVLGPLGMGTCRFLNVLLGYSGFAYESPITLLGYHVAGVVGLYIVGVTWFARSEDRQSQSRQLIMAATVMLLSIIAGLLVPVHLSPGQSPVFYPYLMVGFGFVIGWPVIRAIRQPDSKQVQVAIKRCIMALILLDAILSTATIGWPGLLITLLLLPGIWLGKRVYST